MGHVLKGHREQFLAPIAHDLAHPVVDHQPAAVESDLGDPHGRVVEHRAIARLALGQRAGGGAQGADLVRAAGQPGHGARRVLQRLQRQVVDVAGAVVADGEFGPNRPAGLQHLALQRRQAARVVRRQQLFIRPADRLLQIVGGVVDPGVAKRTVLLEDDRRRAAEGDPEPLFAGPQPRLRGQPAGGGPAAPGDFLHDRDVGGAPTPR